MTLSMSQMSWWIDWKCQRYSPVRRSSATIELANRFCPPRASRPARSAAARVAEGPVDQPELGVDRRMDPRRRAGRVCQESPSQVSLPNSPGRGVPQKCQSTSPLVASSDERRAAVAVVGAEYSTPSW